MSSHEAKLEQSRRLADVLAPGRACSFREALLWTLQLARQVGCLHEAGRLHLGITAEAVTLDERRRPQLLPAAEQVRFGGEAMDPEFCPPELAQEDAVELPTVIEAAAAALRQSGHAIGPRQIDLYQLGTLLYRLLAGQSILQYMYMPSGKTEVPEAIRPVLQRMLGYDRADRYGDFAALIAALEELERQMGVGSELGVGSESSPLPLDGRGESTETPPCGSFIAGPAASTPSQGHAPAPSPPDPETREQLPFARLGHFRILAHIGHGGMGDVYRGHDESLDRSVAIKVLPPELAREADFVRRFHAEATAAARVVHPNVVPIHFIGEDSGYHFFAMQFIDGETVAQRLRREGRLPLDEALHVVEQCLAGLGAAHAQGMIHRDIKPGNIILERDTGRAMVVDFGLVRRLDESTHLTATGMVMGTVDYIAPEQARGQRVDCRADLYSLGVLFYQMLSGRLPFTAETPTAMIFQHAYEEPFPLEQAAPDVPRPVIEIVARLMAKDPNERYQSCAEVLADLHSCRLGLRPDRSQGRVGDPTYGAGVSFDEEAELPAGLASLASNSPWRRLHDWAATIFRRHAPQFVQELQSTTQQVDGAVAHYERRRDRLARLVDEGQRILQDMPDGPERDHQREQLEDLQLQLTKAEATLTRLRSQRDVLLARLHAAERAGATEGRLPTARKRRRAVAAAMLVVLVVWVVVRSLPYDGDRVATVVNVPDGGKVDVTRSASEPPRLAPPAAVAPFDAAQAREYQEQWAKYLGVPVEMTNSIGMKLVLIPPGEFDMGSSSEETSRLVQEIAAKKEDPWYAELTKLETPRHRVRISKPFYMGVYEVTQAEYERVTGNNPSEFSAKGKSAAAVKGQDTARFPVESVCWENAAEFCRKLSALPEESSQGRLYRLPTEAEWENACKAGTTGPEPWDDANLAKDAWFVRNSAAKPHPVGLKQPNAWGLYDMLGNVLEFCSDWDSLDYYAKSPFADPVGPSSGTSRVARGGSYWMSALSCRSTYRYRFPPTMADLQNGFRVVLSVWRPEQSTAKAPSVKTASGAAAAPSLAAPAFDAVQARKHQEQWAQHLGAAAQFTNSVGMKLVLIPPGEFDMGSTPEEINRLLGEIAAKKQDRWYAELTQGEAPRHRVCITRPFYMGVYEVTQAEYERVMGYNPSEFSSKGKGAAATKGEDTGRLPVESVSWDDAADFCRSLSALPEEKSNRRVYRLPTEAEWEYANKAGTTGPSPWDEAALGKEAWFQSNSSTKTHSVGMKRANAWGLYDMLGNVSEWCSDWVGEDYYAKSPFADPTGPSFGQGRAVRGGGFGFPAISCRCTYRYRYAPEWFSWYSGFRVVLTEWSTAPSSQNAQPAVVQPAKR